MVFRNILCRSFARASSALALVIAALACSPLASAATTSTDVVTVFATAPTAYELGTKPGIYTITRSGSTGALVVKYTLSGSATFTATPATDDYTVSGGTAVAGSPITGAVTIPDGSFSAQVIITPINDTVVEGAETVVLSIITDPAYIVGSAFASQITIADDDLTASIELPVLVATEPFKQAGQNPTVDHYGAAVIRAQLKQAFSGGALGEMTFDFGGSATLDTDYQLSVVIGRDTTTSIGTMKESGRRALDGTSSVIGGFGATKTVTDGNFNVIGYQGNELLVTAGSSRQGGGVVGTGVYAAGDWIEFAGVSGIFVVGVANRSGLNWQLTVTPLPPYGLPPFFPANATVITAFPLTGANRWQIAGLQGYDHVEFEIAPVNDALVEGAETVTCQLEASPDFTLRDPTVGTVYIADTTPVVSIALSNNAIEGSVNGAATVTVAGTFPFPVNIPYVVTGTANYGDNLPNPGAPKDYTMTGLDPTTGVGVVTLPAGQSSVQITLVPINDALTETVETATISLLSSLDYALAGSSSSSLNPSATINIGDSTTPIVIVPGTTTTGTAAAGGGSGTGGTTSAVRPLPTNSGNGGCGLGSSLGLIGLALGGVILRRRRAA